jgi:hypothetical protein
MNLFQLNEQNHEHFQSLITDTLVLIDVLPSELESSSFGSLFIVALLAEWEMTEEPFVVSRVIDELSSVIVVDVVGLISASLPLLGIILKFNFKHLLFFSQKYFFRKINSFIVKKEHILKFSFHQGKLPRKFHCLWVQQIRFYLNYRSVP